MKKFDTLLSGALKAQSLENDSIENRIVIREDFQDLIPHLSPEEISQLEQNILKEGVRDPLVLWPHQGSFILVDGHNRYSICKKHNLKFPTKKIDFKDEEAVKIWMVHNQLGRRNLTPEQQSHLRGLRYNQEKSQGRRTDLTSGQNVQKSEHESTASKLAKEYNVSEKTIVRDSNFAKGVEAIGAVDPELKKELLKGKTKLKKHDVEAIGAQKKDIDDVIGGRKSVPTLRKPSAKTIAEIALEYLQVEHANLLDVQQRLSITASDNPLDFFLKWKETRLNQ